jgi:hypothetical protein
MSTTAAIVRLDDEQLDALAVLVARHLTSGWIQDRPNAETARRTRAKSAESSNEDPRPDNADGSCHAPNDDTATSRGR